MAELVRSLCGRRSPPMGGEPDQPLPIRLSEFAGVADSTVRQLCSLAVGGIVTPASACRLALRHAEEIGGPRKNQPPAAGSGIRYELALAGDPFGEFAFHLRGRGGWIVFAPVASIGLLTELCPGVGLQACMLVGCGADGRSTVRLLTAKDWHRRIVSLSNGRNRCGSHHILLLGGLPSREPERSSALTEIEQAVHRGGNTRLVFSTLRKRSEAARSIASRNHSREMLAMIELAFPGLVDVPAPTGGAR